MSGVTIARGGWMFVDDRLGEFLDGRSHVRLVEACRVVERLCERDFITTKVTPRLISRLLKKRKFRKVGMSGSGYDREPLYRLVQSTTLDKTQ